MEVAYSWNWKEDENFRTARRERRRRRQNYVPTPDDGPSPDDVKDWYLDWEDVRDAVYKVAETASSFERRVPEFANYNYMQDSSSACSAINCVRGVEVALGLNVAAGKKDTPERFFVGWNYAAYHAEITKDYSYGGCSISGMAEAIAKFGLLPMSVVTEANSGSVPSDAAMVKMGWNKRTMWPTIKERYLAKASGRQVKTTSPQSEEDVFACLDAGFPIVFGTTRLMQYNRQTGWYEIGRRTAHCECFLPRMIHSADGIVSREYHGGNSYGDNIAPIKQDTIVTLLRNGIPNYGLYAVLDIEGKI